MKTYHWTRAAAAGLVLVGAAAVEVASAAPAAAVPNLVIVTANSWTDSSTEKWATATCPTGTRVLGGGGSIDDGDHYVHFYRLQANASSNTFVAAATEIGTGYSAAWQVHASAVCGSEPAGLEYVSYQSAQDSAGFKAATATCPTGKRLLSVGARTHGGAGEVVIDDIAPAVSLISVTARAYEDESGYGGGWKLWAYGVCANDVLGAELVTDSADDSNNLVIVGRDCPIGKHVHGVGAQITGATGQAMYRGLYPTGADETTGVIHVLEDHTGLAGDWSATVMVICAV